MMTTVGNGSSHCDATGGSFQENLQQNATILVCMFVEFVRGGKAHGFQSVGPIRVTPVDAI